MSKGGGGTSTVTQNPDPWSGAQPYLRQGLHDLQQVYSYGAPTGPTEFGPGSVAAPPYYPASTVAPMSPYTSGAITAQAQRGAAGSPIVDAAQNQVWRTLDDHFMRPESNPYLQGTINAATYPVVRNLNETVLPGVDSAFSAAGRYGSGAHTDAYGQAVDAANRAITDASQRIAYQNYGDERNRQLQTTAFAPTLAQQDYFDINQAGAAGSALDAYTQALINADVERWNYGQDADWRRIQDFLATVNGVAPTGSTSVSRQPVNAFQNALGTAVGGVGLLNMLGLLGGGGGAAGAAATGSALAGALGAFSDARLKENIEPVGMLHNGLNVYAYNYIGDPVTHIGLLAQEVERVKPEAVGSIGGLKTVRYDLATEDA